MMKRPRIPSLGRFAGEALEMMFRKRYLHFFRLEVRTLTVPGTQHVITRVKSEARRIYRKHRTEIPDPQGFFTLGLASLVLASYRELMRLGVEKDEAFESIRRAYTSVYAVPMNRATKLWLAFVPDPVDALRKNSIVPFFKAVFGGWFTFTDESPDGNYTLVLPQCGFYDFFTKEGEPHLTRLMCAMDRNWLGAFDASNRPVATRRSLTLSTGGHRCEFHFDRAAPGPAPTVDVTLRPPENI